MLAHRIDSKKIILPFFLGLLVTALPIMFLSLQNNQYSINSFGQRLNGSYDITLPAASEVSLAQAQSITGFRITMPSELPSGLSLASVRALKVPTGELVYLLFAETKLTGDVSVGQITKAGGVVLAELPDSSDPRPIIQAMINETSGQLASVSIQGAPGIAGGNLFHEVQWWSNGIHYALIASTTLPLSTMIGVANSTG